MALLCSLAGWGTLADNGILSLDIQFVSLLIIPRYECNDQTKYDGVVGVKAFCAGTRKGGRDSCKVSIKICFM